MVVHLESYASPQIKLINELDQAWIARNASLLAKCLHKNYRFVTLPQSLGKPSVNRDEWLAIMAGVLSGTIQFEASYTGCYSILTLAQSLLQPTYHSVVEAPGKVVLHVRVLILSS